MRWRTPCGRGVTQEVCAQTTCLALLVGVCTELVREDGGDRHEAAGVGRPAGRGRQQQRQRVRPAHRRTDDDGWRPLQPQRRHQVAQKDARLRRRWRLLRFTVPCSGQSDQLVRLTVNESK